MYSLFSPQENFLLTLLDQSFENAQVNEKTTQSDEKSKTVKNDQKSY